MSIGSDVLIGELTVLDVYTSIGDGAQLGHTSTLNTGQAVPTGEVGTAPRRYPPT